MLFPPAIRDVLVQENRFAKPDVIPAYCGIDRQSHSFQNAQRQALGDKACSASSTFSDRHHQLAVFAFDLLHHDGEGPRSIPPIDRRLQLAELVARSNVRCLHLGWRFDDGAELLRAARRSKLEGPMPQE
jgi:ATP-dependent DNA ligase